jgi:hypothetical protein
MLGAAAMSWTYTDARRNAVGVIISGFLIAIMFGLARNTWTNDASPIRTIDALDATIESAQWGKGSRAIYVVFLESGRVVLINDDRPHLIGSRVGIERVTRDNGFVFYRFPE